MSDFKAKNLTYDKSQPAFLQRLRAEYSGDRNNVQFARPNKSRLKTGDAEEDDPTIVDEEGEGVSKEDYEEMLRREKEGEAVYDKEDEARKLTQKDTAEGEGEGEQVREKQKIAEVGGGKKRKAGKVVGDFDEGDELHKVGDVAAEQKPNDDKKKAASENMSKSKKKAKKVKLSFDEPGD